MANWKEVTRDEFFNYGFNVRQASVYSSYTSCQENFAETTFSMGGDKPTHKAVHNNGLFAEPNYYINKEIQQ